MDTFVDSAWYFMRYCDPRLEDAMVGAGTRYWMPMDQYIGGIEHAILHLLYARFWTKVMRDMGLVEIDEPFTQALDPGHGAQPRLGAQHRAGRHRVLPARRGDACRRAAGRGRARPARRRQRVEYRGMLKMGKTERNGVDPQELIDRYGADTARLFVMFASPPEQTLEWNNAGVEGANRFLRRALEVRRQARRRDRFARRARQPGARRSRRRCATRSTSVLRQVSYDYERMQYNTVVSGAMKLLNALEAHAGEDGRAGAAARGLRHPAARRSIRSARTRPGCSGTSSASRPSTATCSTRPGRRSTRARSAQDEIELVLQINGKLRGSIRVPPSAERAQIEAAALASPEFAKFAAGRAAKKVMVVPGRLVNVVV